MPYPEFTKEMLANFTGRPLPSFPSFVTNSAIPQALLLFKLGTCLASLDDLSSENKQLAQFAILAMADAIHLAQPYQSAVASPFSSESIGSYSYSKTAKAVAKREETNVMWFDLAISELSVCGANDDILTNGGIEVFENDGQFTFGHGGNSRLLSPENFDLSASMGYDPSPNSVYGG